MLLDDGISTVAYGHYKVTGEIVDVITEPAPMIRERAGSFSGGISLVEDLRRAVEEQRKTRPAQSCPVHLTHTLGFADANAERPDQRSLEFSCLVLAIKLKISIKRCM